MTITYSGRVLWANAAPVPNVEVRLFRQLVDQSFGAELTLLPGTSDLNGNFTIITKDSRFVDSALITEYDLLSSKFDEIDPRDFDLGEELRPILEFTFLLNGNTVITHAPFRRIHRGYFLPYNYPVNFLPSNHGFDFVNNFKLFEPRISLPFGLDEKLIPPSYGLCGGMAASAYDYRLASLNNPKPPDIRNYHAVPKTGTRLQRFLLRRSFDTFGAGGANVGRIGDWTLLPDDGSGGVRFLSLQELPDIMLNLQLGQCVVLALIYERATTFNEMLQKIWLNHQVLAYSGQELGPDQFEIRIYDSNYKNRDDVTLNIEAVQVGTSADVPIYGALIREKIPARLDQEVRGIFPMTYQACTPPKK